MSPNGLRQVPRSRWKLDVTDAVGFVGLFAARTGWGSAPTVTDLPDMDPAGGTTVQALVHGDCGGYRDGAGNARLAESLLNRMVNAATSGPAITLPARVPCLCSPRGEHRFRLICVEGRC